MNSSIICTREANLRGGRSITIDFFHKRLALVGVAVLAAAGIAMLVNVMPILVVGGGSAIGSQA